MKLEASYDPIDRLLRAAMRARPEPVASPNIARLAIAMAHYAQKRQSVSQVTLLLGYRRQIRMLRYVAAIAITVIIGLGTWRMAALWGTSPGMLEAFTELSADFAGLNQGWSALGVAMAVAVLVGLGIVLFAVDNTLSDEYPRVPQG